MTLKTILIAMIAGGTSVVLLIAGQSGTFLAFPFLLLSLLPIAILGFGWGSRLGFLSATVASAGLAAAGSSASGYVFAAVLGLPVAYLVHTAGLSRQDDPARPMEWFPVGAVLIRAVLLGGAIVGLSLALSGFDAETVTKTAIDALAAPLGQLDETTRKTLEEAIAFQIRLLPYSLAMVWLLVIWLNLTLAIKITRISQRFARPSFRLRDAELPPLTAALFALALIAALAEPPLAHIGAAFVGASGVALVILGLDTLHAMTARLPARHLLLGLLYAVTLVFAILALPLFALGLADLFFKIRRRYRASHPE